MRRTNKYRENGKEDNGSGSSVIPPVFKERPAPALRLSLDGPSHLRPRERLSVLALLLERVAEQACGDTWRNIRDDLKRIKLAQLSSPNGTVWQVTEPTQDGANRLKSLEINKPPPILQVD